MEGDDGDGYGLCCRDGEAVDAHCAALVLIIKGGVGDMVGCLFFW